MRSVIPAGGGASFLRAWESNQYRTRCKKGDGATCSLETLLRRFTKPYLLRKHTHISICNTRPLRLYRFENRCVVHVWCDLVCGDSGADPGVRCHSMTLRGSTRESGHMTPITLGVSNMTPPPVL
jgi:hypothetical protein